VKDAGDVEDDEEEEEKLLIIAIAYIALQTEFTTFSKRLLITSSLPSLY
jgi:hypothetical protein